MEKTTELLRVMRNEKFYRDGKEDESVKRIVKSYADRIEDAIKRDYTGNVEKLREALGVARELLLPQCHYDIPYSKNCVAAVEKIDSALAEPPRNCDRFKSEYDYDKLHEAFVKHCDSCNCPMGCIHRRDTRCMLDTRCGSILKCFAKFVLAESKGDAK